MAQKSTRELRRETTQQAATTGEGCSFRIKNHWSRALCPRVRRERHAASQPQLGRVFVLFRKGELFGDCFFWETGHQEEMRSARIGA